MTRPTDPTRYPSFLYKVINELDKRPNQPFEFPCQSVTELRNFQGTFNSFKKAAMDHGWDKTRCPSIASMVCRIDKERFIATVFCIDTDPAYVRWGRVVGIEPPEDRKEPEREAYAKREPCEHEWMDDLYGGKVQFCRKCKAKANSQIQLEK